MRKQNSRNSNNSDKMLIIQCPECQTKFSIKQAKLSNLTSDPQFHCSKCDNLFTIKLEDLDPDKKSQNNLSDDFEIDANNNSIDKDEFEMGDSQEESQEEYEEEYEKGEDKEEEYEETEEEDIEDDEEDDEEELENDEENEEEDAENNEDVEYEGDEEDFNITQEIKQKKYLRHDNYFLDSKGNRKNNKNDDKFVLDNDDNTQISKKRNSKSSYTDEDSFYEDVKGSDTSKINRKSAFIKDGPTVTRNIYNNSSLKTSSYKSNSNKTSEFDSWLNSKTNNFNNDFDNFSNDSNQENDLLAMPKKNHFADSKKSFEFNNRKKDTEKADNVQKKVRSWEAVYKLCLPFVCFLIVLAFCGFYLQSNNTLFKKIDLGIFKTGKVPPAGLFLKNVKILNETLNNGENIKIITGRVLNDSDKVIYDDDILLEGILFDDDSNVLLSKQIKASSELGLHKTSELRALESGILEKMQNSKSGKKQRLTPGAHIRFAIVFTDSKKFKNATKYATRIYSVEMK